MSYPPQFSLTQVQPPPPQAWQRIPSPGPQLPPNPAPGAQGQRAHPVPEGAKSYIVTLLLSYFLGFWGIDRFYLGKTPSALVKLFTLGGFGYWWLIDVLITLFGGQRDVMGLRLRGYDRFKKTVWIVLGAIFGGPLMIGLIVGVGGALVRSAGPSALVWALLAIVGAGATTAGAIWFTRRHGRGRPARVRRGQDPVPPRIRTLLETLAEVRMKYVAHASSGSEAAAGLVQRIDALGADTTELFGRVAAKADAAQRAGAEIEYEEKLGKLVNALGDGYLLDVFANPRLWDEPDQRIRDVQAALDATDAELVDDMRQVNAHRGIGFTVAVDGLAGPRKAMDDWQRDFDRAAGDGQSPPNG